MLELKPGKLSCRDDRPATSLRAKAGCCLVAQIW
jgi:hypothetical protein